MPKSYIGKVSCSHPTSEIAKVNSLIKGNWNWEYEKYLSRTFQTYIIKTPQSEGVRREYYFSIYDQLFIFKNGDLERTALYEITTMDVVTGSDMDQGITTLLIKDESDNQIIDFAPIKVCNDTLTMDYQVYSDIQGQEKWSKN